MQGDLPQSLVSVKPQPGSSCSQQPLQGKTNLAIASVRLGLLSLYVRTKFRSGPSHPGGLLSCAIWNILWLEQPLDTGLTAACLGG